MANPSSAVPDVVEQVRAAGAKRLKAEFAGGETKAIAIPEVRNKWKRLRALLRNLGDAWLRIEGFDAAGALLVVIDNPDANELEDLEPDYATDSARQLSPLLGLMLKAQDVALSRQERQLKQILDANAQLLSLVSQRLVESERALARQYDRNREYAERVQELILAGETGDGDGNDAIIAALLPHMLKGKTPNGAPEK